MSFLLAALAELSLQLAERGLAFASAPRSRRSVPAGN